MGFEFKGSETVDLVMRRLKEMTPFFFWESFKSTSISPTSWPLRT